jgi:hypothetical protein
VLFVRSTIRQFSEEALCTEVDPAALSGDLRHHLKFTLARSPTAFPYVKSHSAYWVTCRYIQELTPGERLTAALSVSGRWPGQVT